MRKSRCNEEQMVTILCEADRTSVAETAKKHKMRLRLADSALRITLCRPSLALFAPAWRARLRSIADGPLLGLRRGVVQRPLRVGQRRSPGAPAVTQAWDRAGRNRVTADGSATAGRRRGR